MRQRVSVIVPVYKAEKYLADCMNSILRQDYPDIEIILVDDGSPDRCPEICDKYAEEYANVKVVHQRNQGAGESRNKGMSVSTGKYLFFVDSDDCLDGNNAVSTLVQCAEENAADIVVGNFRKLTENGCSDVNCHHLEVGEYTETVDFRFKGFFQCGHLGFNWGKCYKKEFLEQYNLRCANYPFSEDKAMNMCCCVCRPIYAFVDESVYLYRVNEESASYQYRDNLMDIWIANGMNLSDFVKANNIQRDYKDVMDFHIFLGLFTIIQQEIQAGNTKISSMTKQLKKYGNNKFVRECLKDLAKGKYVFSIESLMWKVMIWGASVMFVLHGYIFIAFGFKVLNMSGLDKKIVDSKYKNEEKK